MLSFLLYENYFIYVKMSIKTADRTLDMIELFAREGRPLNLSDIAALLNMPVSSSHGLIKTLQVRGYLYELGRRQGYYPTKKLTLMANAIAAATPLLQTLEPRLSELRNLTEETVVLAKRQGDTVTYLDVFESGQSVRFSPLVGEIKPLHSTASGKAVLGTLSPAELVETISRLVLTRITEKTIADPKRLTEEIEQGRKRGWHYIVGENVPDLMSIAAPARVGSDFYIVAVGGPIQRFKPLMERHAEKLLKTCAAIEKQTG